MTECKECQKMRADWLDAMIALDVARVAKVTGQAVAHMVGGGNGTELHSADSELRGKKRKVLASRVQKSGGAARG